MKTKKDSLLHYYSIRNFAIFSAGFFFITILLTAFVVIPKINASIESNYIEELEVELTLEVELFTRYVQSQKTILQDIVKFPSLASALKLAEGANLTVSDLFNRVVIGGEKGQLVLQDIDGNVLVQTSNNLQGAYTDEPPWLESILDGSIAYHFLLLGQNQEYFTFQMSIPVTYDSGIAGVLSAVITVDLSRILVTQALNKNVAFKISQEQRTIYTEFGHIEIAR
ncbi:MAG: hypothetical protein JKY14_04485, partial [Paraglaciecola sp.]|nr:hypothetical protein [Paraglaciecola sp.]